MSRHDTTGAGPSMPPPREGTSGQVVPAGVAVGPLPAPFEGQPEPLSEAEERAALRELETALRQAYALTLLPTGDFQATLSLNRPALQEALRLTLEERRSVG